MMIFYQSVFRRNKDQFSWRQRLFLELLWVVALRTAMYFLVYMLLTAPISLPRYIQCCFLLLYLKTRWCVKFGMSTELLPTVRIGMILTAATQVRGTHLLLFSLGRRSKLCYGVWDASERSKPALILLKQVEEPPSLSFGANALSTGLLLKGGKINSAGFQNPSHVQIHFPEPVWGGSSAGRAALEKGSLCLARAWRIWHNLKSEEVFFPLMLQWPS